METTEKTIEVVNDLIVINNDRAAGFDKAADSLGENDQDLKPIFMKMANESANNSKALTSLISQLGGDPEPGTSFTGSVHRAWLSVESLFSGSDRETILSECERGEDAIKQAYRDALAMKDEIDPRAVTNIQLQQGTINSGHELVKSLRNSSKNGGGNPAIDGENKYSNNQNGNSFEQQMPDNHTIVAENETDPQFNFENSARGKRVPEPDFNDDDYAAEDTETLQPVTNDSKLQEFFINELKDLLWAEKKLVDTLPKMEEAATSVQLREAFHSHLAQTEGHVQRLEQIFGVLGLDPDTTKCEAMDGIVDEGEEIIDDTDEGTATRDVGLIFAGQKAEHYEIASYGGMVSLAKTLGYNDAAAILTMTLNEEKAADALLTEIAENNVNYSAVNEQE